MYTNLTNISIIRKTIPHYCIREKSKIPLMLTCLETCNCYCLMSFFDAAHAMTRSAMSNPRPACGPVEGFVRPVGSSRHRLVWWGGMRCRFAIQSFTGPYCVNQSLSHTYFYEETSLSLV